MEFLIQNIYLIYYTRWSILLLYLAYPKDHVQTIESTCVNMLYNIYYNLKTLELNYKRNLVLGLTQENLIENSVQDCLPYILNYHSSYYYFSSLP